MATAPWYQTFFGDEYLRIYDPLLTPERTAREVDGITALLNLPAGSAILDLCCGHGRHAITLARRGYRVTGQDLSAVFLHKAQEDAAAQQVQVRWVQSDMRSIPFEAEFDGVINIFTAFGYLESEDEDGRVLAQVCRAIKPGGLFLIELVNRDGLIGCYQGSGITRHDDGTIVTEERRFDPLSGRNEVRLTVFYPDGHRTEHMHSVRVYSLTEMARLCSAAGLSPEAYYGSLDGTPFTLDRLRLVLLCRKP
jgi:SAM-dependent methyltransferase